MLSSITIATSVDHSDDAVSAFCQDHKLPCVRGELDNVVGRWRENARALLDALGWADATLHERRYAGGVSLAFTAPIVGVATDTLTLTQALWVQVAMLVGLMALLAVAWIRIPTKYRVVKPTPPSTPA